MILIIPSIELTGGTSSYCIIGEKGTENFYKSLSDDPLSLSKLWRKENSKSLNLIDNDSFISEDNYLNANAILYIADSIDIPVQLYSNFRSCGDAAMYLDNGVYRVTLSDLPLLDPEGVSKLIHAYSPSRVSFDIPISKHRVKFNNKEVMDEIEYASFIKGLGAQRAVYSKVDCYDPNVVVDFDALENFALKSKLRLTLNQGISKPEHLWKLSELASLGIDSVILGKVLYENRFPCQKIWREIEAELEVNSL